ncbi:MAG TPA: membrane protein insertion efficiency factor YidD [Rickettsiales bacterium]|nr:membrane protein insertion efficiency factor YidD [Rickettsiales bacterium]
MAGNDKINKIVTFPIRFYRYLISPLIGGQNACKFNPTCSQYMILAIEKKGILKGITLGIWRILRCNPWSKGGEDRI